MTPSVGFEALRRANPRSRPGFARDVEAADGVRTQILCGAGAAPREPRRAAPPPRLLRLSTAGAALAAAAVAAAALTIGTPGGGTPGVESAAAAVREAAAVTAESARRSGTAIVQITLDGEPWAGKTVRWNGGDIEILDNGSAGPRPRPGRTFRMVDGLMYSEAPDGGWEILGTPDSIDPGSGTPPDAYLAATRDDVGGAALRRIGAGLTTPTTGRLDDGSTLYRGRVAAGLIATGTGLKEGRRRRLFPFGYVAHDEAGDPAALLDVALTVGADGVVRRIAVTWGVDARAWSYTVTYVDLGATPAIVAPSGARPLREWRPARRGAGG